MWALGSRNEEGARRSGHGLARDAAATFMMGAGSSWLVFLIANVFSTLWIFGNLWWLPAADGLVILASGWTMLGVRSFGMMARALGIAAVLSLLVATGLYGIGKSVRSDVRIGYLPGERMVVAGASWDLSAGYLVSEFPKPWACPALLLSDWSIPNVALLGAGIAILFVTDHVGYAAWGIFVGLESVFAMLGTSYRYKSVGDLVLVALAWLVLLAMVETGIWLTRQMRMNRWAHQLAALNAENSMRRAAREAHARDEHQPEG